MKIVIAGGGGFVGKNLIRVMKEEGFLGKDTVVIDKDIKGLESVKKHKVKTILADVSGKGDWVESLKGADILINLAAQISAKEYAPFWKNNVETTKELIAAAKKHKVKKIIHFSSAAVLSVRKDWYAETKKESEDIIVKSRISSVILRPSLMFGPEDDKNIGYLINFARKSPIFPIPGSGDYPRQPIFIDDVCRLTISIAKKFRKGSVHSINGKDTLPFGEMIKTVLRNMKGIHIPLHIPIPIFKFMMMTYQKVFGEKFTTDQVDSLVSGDVFPDYAWWDDYNVRTTTYEEGIRIMLAEKGLLKK